MKRVAVIADYWMGGTHGVRKNVPRILQGEAFKDSEFQFEIINCETGILNSAEPEGIPPLPEEIPIRTFKVNRYYALIPLFVDYFRANKPDLIFSVCNPAHIGMVWIAHRVSRSRARIVWTVRNSMEESLKAFRFKKVFHWLTGIAFRGGDRVVAVGTDLARGTQERYRIDPSIVLSIPQPLDLEFIARAAKEEAPHPWFGTGGSPLVVTVCRLDPVQKDLMTLLAAFQRVREQRDVRLVVVGDGPQRPDLEEEISARGLEESVLLAGYHANPCPLVARADLFVLSTHGEGLPTVLLEAMAVGTPVVASDVDFGPREALDEGRCGLLVPPRDPEALSLAMERVLTDDALRKRLTELAKEYVKRWGDRQVDQEFVDLFRQVLGGGK